MKRVALLLAIVLASGTAGPTSAASVPTGCARSALATAAAELVSEHARVASADEVFGFTSAVVSDPVLVGGAATHRLVAVDGMWCGVRGFDAAWEAAGRPTDAAGRASAFARVAGHTWFGDVTVRSAKAGPLGIVRLETHGLRNGVVASWVVSIDGRGIRTATWTATAIGVEPFVAELDGLTALPTATRTFTRTPRGLALDGPLLATDDDELEVMAEATMSDGFTVQIRNGDTPLGVVLDTGQDDLDIIRHTRDAAVANYEEFLSWGLTGWAGRPAGRISIDDALSLNCIACVLITDSFNIHMSSQTVEILGALGFTYPDRRAAFSNVLGHEMFHNFQLRAWGAANLRVFPLAVIEGMARFQETLHTYSEVSHQPGSLIYMLSPAGAGNACNDYLKRRGVYDQYGSIGIMRRDGSLDTDASAALGPVRVHGYDSCLFFMTWYPAHGIEAVVQLLDAPAQGDTAWAAFKWAVEYGSGPIADELARFGARLLTLDGMQWGPAAGDGPVLDWSEHLIAWEPSTTDGPATQTLYEGGMMAVRVEQGGTVSLEGEARLYVVDSDGSFAPVSPGDQVGPQEGDEAWLLAVNTGGPSIVTMGIS